MELSVIIVSWNVKDRLRENLAALFASTVGGFEVFVVDNASHDGTAAMVREEFPQVSLIANSENLGFAKANNQALRRAVGKYALLLNPDMRVESDTVSQMLAWAKSHPQATVCGCHLVDEAGRTVLQVRRFPRFWDQLLITLKVPHFLPSAVDGYLEKGFDYAQATKVDSIRGAFFLIDRESWRQLSGGQDPLLDERYFVWFEEVDFCRETYRLGGEVWYAPAARCVDHVGASFRQLPLGTSQAYFSDSMIKYFAKWEAPWQARLLAFAWRLVRALVWIRK